MSDIFYYLIMILSTLISTGSQVMLKKAAKKGYSSLVRQYLNFFTIMGYGCMFLSTVCSLIAHRVVPVSMAPVWSACGMIFVAIASRIFFGEKPSKKKLCGMGIMIVGILIFML